MDRFKRRSRNTIGSQLIKKLEEQRESKNSGTPVSDSGRKLPKRWNVPCSRHEGRELGHAPCLLSATLQEEINPNALLQVRSKLQPELRFYARAHPGNFVQSVRGISILRAIAEQAKITDIHVELEEVPEEEARLSEAIMIIGDCYMSSRDLWHMHLAMMQEGGQLVYRGCDRNLWPHANRSRVERLVSKKGDQVLCGLVGPSTEVVFKSSSANLFVLVQVSAELFTFGLAGRPYWEVLLECFSQLLDKALKGSEGGGHYVHMVLFARTKRRMTADQRLNKPPRFHPRTDSKQPMQPPARKALPAPGEHEDFYDVFWEGFTKAMPPAQQLVARVRQVCAGLHERSWNSEGWLDATVGDGAGGSPDAWDCISAGDIVEASRGNVLECLNLVLDSFDQHHLDRMLRVSGQMVLLLTAGNGLLQPESRELYELTHERFVTAGFQRGFHMLCVREPPLHPVPWIHWPGGPGPYDAEPPAEPPLLPPQPPWLRVAYHREVSFCPCLPTAQWMSASFLPIERLRRAAHAPLHVPEWSEAQCALASGAGSGSSRKSTGEGSGQWPTSPPPTRPRQSPAPRRSSDELWKDVRVPYLRSYFNTNSRAETYRKAVDSYFIESSRFSDTDWECINIMSDLIGLRLASVGSAQLCRLGGAGPARASPRADFEFGCPKESTPAKEPWAMQGNLIPQALHCLVVQTGSGTQWTFEPCEAGCLNISHNTSDSKRQPAADLTYRYSGFYVRQHVARRVESEDPCPDSRVASRNLWVPTNRVFHLQEGMSWNELDTIIAGNLPMPPALPYPVERRITDIRHDRCPGWRLRGALKQHLFVLVPTDSAARSHAELFRCARQILRGEIGIGVDPFEVVEAEKGMVFREGGYSMEVREQTLKNFGTFKKGLEDLCFGKRPVPQVLEISHDVDATSFEVKRGRSEVNIRDVKIDSAFPASRDWFEFFYDSTYSPPKCFHLVLQWIACSSIHVANLLPKLVRLAEDCSFAFVQLPVVQLFPQPAPHWVWTEDQETNFDRLAFYPRRRLPLPPCGGEEGRRRLYCQLLECWAEALGFIFIFSSPVQDFDAVALPDLDSQGRATCKVHQRLKGWVLCDPKGLCLIALRKDFIHWIESWLPLAEARDSHDAVAKLQQVDRLRRDFFKHTEPLLAEAAAAGDAAGHPAAPSTSERCPGRPSEGGGTEGAPAPCSCPPAEGREASSPCSPLACQEAPQPPAAPQRGGAPARDFAEGPS